MQLDATNLICGLFNIDPNDCCCPDCTGYRTATLPSTKIDRLAHDDLVRYIGPTDRDFRVTHGQTYHTFGTYPKPAPRGDEISICVHDPNDDFGGVVSRPASLFERIV